MTTMNNLTDTELETLEQQYAHVSAENKRMMDDNRRLRDALAHLIADMAGIAPTVPQPHHKRMCAAIERARGRADSGAR